MLFVKTEIHERLNQYLKDASVRSMVFVSILSTAQQNCRCSSALAYVIVTSIFVCFCTLGSKRGANLISRSKNPPHQGAFSMLNVHRILYQSYAKNITGPKAAPQTTDKVLGMQRDKHNDTFVLNLKELVSDDQRETHKTPCDQSDVGSKTPGIHHPSDCKAQTVLPELVQEKVGLG